MYGIRNIGNTEKNVKERKNSKDRERKNNSIGKRNSRLK